MANGSTKPNTSSKTLLAVANPHQCLAKAPLVEQSDVLAHGAPIELLLHLLDQPCPQAADVMEMLGIFLTPLLVLLGLVRGPSLHPAIKVLAHYNNQDKTSLSCTILSAHNRHVFPLVVMISFQRALPWYLAESWRNVTPGTQYSC